MRKKRAIKGQPPVVSDEHVREIVDNLLNIVDGRDLSDEMIIDLSGRVADLKDRSVWTPDYRKELVRRVKSHAAWRVSSRASRKEPLPETR